MAFKLGRNYEKLKVLGIRDRLAQSAAESPQ